MILEHISSPEDVKKLDRAQLPILCQELRQFLVDSVSRTGGHLASNLGAVELTVAIHRVFDTSQDRLVFDVGHQCYVHKALTGRRELFSTLRQFGGLGGDVYKRQMYGCAPCMGNCGQARAAPGPFCLGTKRGGAENVK